MLLGFILQQGDFRHVAWSSNLLCLYDAIYSLLDQGFASCFHLYRSWAFVHGLNSWYVATDPSCASLALNDVIYSLLD